LPPSASVAAASSTAKAIVGEGGPPPVGDWGPPEALTLPASLPKIVDFFFVLVDSGAGGGGGMPGGAAEASARGGTRSASAGGGAGGGGGPSGDWGRRGSGRQLGGISGGPEVRETKSVRGAKGERRGEEGKSRREETEDKQ